MKAGWTGVYTARMFRAMAVLALAVIVMGVGAAATGMAVAQCAMCGTALQDGDDPLRDSVASSALFMASMPFALFATVAGWILWRTRRGPGPEDEPLDLTETNDTEDVTV